MHNQFVHQPNNEFLYNTSYSLVLDILRTSRDIFFHLHELRQCENCKRERLVFVLRRMGSLSHEIYVQLYSGHLPSSQAHSMHVLADELYRILKKTLPATQARKITDRLKHEYRIKWLYRQLVRGHLGTESLELLQAASNLFISVSTSLQQEDRKPRSWFELANLNAL